MTDTDDNDRPQPPSAARVGTTVHRITIVLIAVGLLTAFHFALQHGEYVDSVRRRGLDTFAVGLAIRESVQRPSGDGLFPAWDPHPGILFFDPTQVNRFYTVGPRVNQAIQDPGDAVLIAANLVDNRLGYLLEDLPDGARWFYLPYAVRNEAEGLALLDAYRAAASSAQPSSAQPWSDNLPAPAGQGTGGTNTFYRLHRTIQQDLKEAHRDLPEENFLRENFPVLIERPGDSDGGWVVFFDRDPVWMDYPGEFPMTERFMEALTALETEMRPTAE